jgi:hypothetical protein
LIDRCRETAIALVRDDIYAPLSDRGDRAVGGRVIDHYNFSFFRGQCIEGRKTAPNLGF